MGRVAAQDNPAAATLAATEDAAAQRPPVRAADRSPGVDQEEDDLIARVRDCEVLTVSGDQFAAILTVSGQVVSPGGDPVEGAIVVLRESSASRIYSDREQYFHRGDPHLVRALDVFARTTTDRNGTFEFREVKAPALPKFWTNPWRGNVIAAHADFGMGWVALGDKKGQLVHKDLDLTVSLRPTSSISGRFVSPQSAPIGQATINVYQLAKPAMYPSRSDDLDLQMSQLAPRIQTDTEGRFRISGLPVGLAAMLQTSHPAWVDGTAAIATSQDVPLGEQSHGGGKLHNETILGAPADVVADPGLFVAGQVVGPDGAPAPNVRVSYLSTTVRQQTDQQGRFRLRLRTRWIEDDIRFRESYSKFYSAPPQGSNLLFRYDLAPVDDLIAEKPLMIQLEQGVRVSGKVVTEEGKPLAGANVCPVSLTGRTADITDSEGSYELLLAKTEHIILVGTDEPGYLIPKRFEVFSVKTPEAALKLPHQRVDLSDGVETVVPPIVVPLLRSFRVIASLPDGRPAIGAKAIIKDLQEVRNGNQPVSFPPITVEKSDAVVADRIGQADLAPHGVITENAYLEIKLNQDDQAFEASVPVSSAIDNRINVVLTPAWVVEGRVFIDDQPVVGAIVSIGQMKTQRRTSNGRTIMFSTVSKHQQAVTNKDGWYRAAVSAGKEYTVSLQSLPDHESHPGVGYRPLPAGNGRLRAKDFSFIRGKQEIAGRVIDKQGNGIAGANVRVMTPPGVQSGFWIGHQSESQNQTDALGRFHLKRMPAGRYQLRVRGPTRGNQRRGVEKMIDVDAGTTDLEITLDAGSLADILP